MTNRRYLEAWIAAVVVAVSVFTAPSDCRAVHPLDVFEPNDTMSTANTLVEGETQQHFIKAGADSDWIRFTATAGRTYAIGTNHVYHLGGPVYFLFDADGNALVNELDIFSNTRLTFTPRKTGTYYLKVVGVTYISADPSDIVYHLSLISWAETPPSGDLTRVQGTNRYATAEAIARKQFPGWKRSDGRPVDYVIIASGEDRAVVDALGAASLAGALDAPVLLVPYRRDGYVPPETMRCIKEMWTTSGSRLNQRFIGGPLAVSWETEAAFAGFRSKYTQHNRLFGPNRYETAGRIADNVDQIWRNSGFAVSPTVLVADGRNESLYDALAASPIAASGPVPLLLTDGSSIPEPTSRRLALGGRLGATDEVWVVNSAGRISDATARKLRAVKPDGAVARIAMSTERSAAAVDITRWGIAEGYLSGREVGVVNGIPDAISAGSLLGAQRAGLVYCNATAVPTATQLYLAGPIAGVRGYVFGGNNAISADAFDKMRGYVR